jgi:hypothetical protein
MSCANRTCSSTIVGSQTSYLAQYSSVATPSCCVRKMERATKAERSVDRTMYKQTANESKSNKDQHMIKPRIVPDRTHTDPE